jgi:uncharacterized protein (TIGR02597 family)
LSHKFAKTTSPSSIFLDNLLVDSVTLSMKRFLLTLLCGLLTVACPAQVTSPIVGFLTLHLQEGTNFLGFALLPGLELQTAFTVAAGNRQQIFLQGNGLVLIDDQFNSGPLPSHAIEIITAGPGQGFTSVITGTLATGLQLNLAEAVPAEVADGATLKVWRLWTLASVFGTDNEAGLTGAESPGSADLVLLPNGEGFDRYFFSTGGALGRGWRREGAGTTDQAQAPLPLTGGVALFARSAKAVVLTGQVKPGHSRVQLQTGHNYVANLCPVNAAGANASAKGRTLENSGLAAGLQGATASEQADLVLLWNGGGYDAYFHSTGGALESGWRKIGAGKTDQAGVALPDGAYVILRRGAPTPLVLHQGDF